MSKSRYPEGLSEIKDFRGDHQIRIVQSGNITYKSTEGYKNKLDMRDAAINSAIILLTCYADQVTEQQKTRLFRNLIIEAE